MVSFSDTTGRLVLSVILWTWEPEILNSMMSISEGLLLPLESSIACLSEPAPESLVVVTVKVAGAA